jgi:acetyl esterase
VYLHGGGWVLGDLDAYDGLCRTLAAKLRCVVVSVDYRLAPEHRFPNAPEDCYAAARWVAENAASLGIDPGSIAVGGDSAGGNLAAVVALMARDRGGPRIAYQILVYPVTERSFDTGSYRDNGADYFLTTDMMIHFWKEYLSGEDDAASPYASPLRAKDLKGLPPALVITAEFDPLRDEGETYAKRLEQAGVPVRVSRYDGMIHGFYAMPSVFPQALEAIEETADWFRGRLKAAAA